MNADFVDIDRAESASKSLLDADSVSRLSETFRVLGDPTRLNMVLALRNTELCVLDIASLLGATESAVSHQLRLLKAMRIVKLRREGKLSYYSLDDEHIAELLDLGTSHIVES